MSREQTEAALLKKVAWANLRGYETGVVTQFCFNVQAIRQWIQKVRDANIDAPIYIGLAGSASFKTLLHYASICGVSVSINQFIKQPIQMCNLFLHGDPKHLINALMKQPEIRAQITGFHLFPFGGINKTIQWAEDFSKSEKIYSSL
jgi:methylenetetrahydrofolate reductase (NADPH)